MSYDMIVRKLPTIPFSKHRSKRILKKLEKRAEEKAETVILELKTVKIPQLLADKQKEAYREVYKDRVQL